MKRPTFSYSAAAGVALIVAACAEAPSSVSRAPDPGQAVRPFARPEAPARAPADASALVGRDARAVAKLLGEPQLKRRDPPAELWQYRAGPCVLDLFFYADKAGSAATVAHVEMRAVPPVGGRNTESPRATGVECLRALTNASGRG